MEAYKIGDRVVYRAQKYSASPSPQAREVNPSESGENYTYVVDKYWTVCSIINDSKIEICTRRGKRRVIERDDPGLRKATIVEKLRYRRRFPALERAFAGN